LPLTYRVHRPFRNSCLTLFYFIYLFLYIHIQPSSLLSTVSLRRLLAAAPVDNNRTPPATCAYVSIETRGNLPARPSVKEKNEKGRGAGGESTGRDTARRPGQQTYVTRVINCASGRSTCTSACVISITRLVPLPPASCFNSFSAPLLASKLGAGGSILPLASGTGSRRGNRPDSLPAVGGSFFHPFFSLVFEVSSFDDDLVKTQDG
jgi:hypothetical protein